MKKLYFCPICKSYRVSILKRIVDSQDCCSYCCDFLKATKQSYNPFVDPHSIQERTLINTNHPSINSQLLHNILKDCKIFGEYTNRSEIVSVISTLRQHTYNIYNMELRYYEHFGLITDGLNSLDYLYGINFQNIKDTAQSTQSLNDHYYSRNLGAHYYVGLIGKALERIVESALVSDNCSKTPRSQSFIYLIELAVFLTEMNSLIENVVSMPVSGILSITNNSIKWKMSQQNQQIFDNMMAKWSKDDVKHIRDYFRPGQDDLKGEEYILALSQLDSQEIITGKSKLGFDEEEFCVLINPVHKQLFGHSYSQRLCFLLVIGNLPLMLNRDWIFEDEIIDYLSEKLNYNIAITKSLLSSLCLFGLKVKAENALPFEFRRNYRLNRRPLTKLSFSNRSAYFVSAPIISRAFLNIQVEYRNGSHPELESTKLMPIIRRIDQSYADYFVRERIMPIFKQNNFYCDYHLKHLGRFDLERECGEIDILAINDKKLELIVAECKFKIAKEIHVSQIRKEMQIYTKPETAYCDILSRKCKWINEHIEEVFGHFNLSKPLNNVAVTPVFINSYYCPVSDYITSFIFITEYELDSWLKNHSC